MRYTKKDVQGMFGRLCRLISDEKLGLDYNSVYGGYVIVKYQENGGESHPYASLRRNAKEMYLSLYMTVCVLEKIKYEVKE